MTFLRPFVIRTNPFIDLFIDLFESALRTSEDKLAHLHLPKGEKVTGQRQYRCVVPKAVYTVKSAPEDGRVCRPKNVEQIQIDQ